MSRTNPLYVRLISGWLLSGIVIGWIMSTDAKDNPFPWMYILPQLDFENIGHKVMFFHASSFVFLIIGYYIGSNKKENNK